MKLLLHLITGIICSVILVGMWCLNTVIVIVEEIIRLLFRRSNGR